MTANADDMNVAFPMSSSQKSIAREVDTACMDRYRAGNQRILQNMSIDEIPGIYLISPREIDVFRFPETLARVLDGQPVACLRLSLATQEESAICRAADACRTVAHERDVPVVIETHFLLAENLGLDGVHLTDGVRMVRKARNALKSDAIVGSFCGSSRHDGINAGEAGADYISFGPIATSQLGDGSCAEFDLFEWWSQMIELPVVAEGGMSTRHIQNLAPVVDFLAIGREIWRSDNPAAELTRLAGAIG